MTVICDPIYYFSNNIEIDQVAKEILETPEFCRLKGIKQAGITGLFTQRTYDRAEHSLGVYLLLKFLGASLEQCIGGLLHDIYHTNFSHTTDELFCGEKQESFHEKNKYLFFERCCKKTIQILNKYFPTVDYKFFMEGKNMEITKNKSFGADMLDYFMRDGFYEKLITLKWINKLLSNISLKNGKIILSDVTIAKDFFKKTILINDTAYMSPFSRGQYKIFTNILKYALDFNVVNFDMLVYGFNTDQEIYEIIKSADVIQIKSLIKLLENTAHYSFKNEIGHNWRKVNTIIIRKLRYLDPYCLIDSCFGITPKIISEIDTDISELLSKKKEQYDKEEELFIESELGFEMCK
jgi:hypothetical protein